MRAARKKSRYKNDETWLNAVYKKNKAEIDAALEGVGGKNKKKIFKQLVKEYQEDGLTAKQALSKLERSTIFTTTGERLRKNAREGITTDQEAWKRFRELTKVHGKYTKVDVDKLVWNNKSKRYEYVKEDGTIVFITFRNSPVQVIVGSYNPNDIGGR